MFLCLINPKLCRLEEAVVPLLNLCRLAELRKQKLKVEILHDFKEFLKEFLKFQLCSIII